MQDVQATLNELQNKLKIMVRELPVKFSQSIDSRIQRYTDEINEKISLISDKNQQFSQKFDKMNDKMVMINS